MTAPRRRTRTGKTSTSVDVGVPPPAGLRASTVVLDDDEYLVLTVPIPVWEMPDCLTDAERAVATSVLGGSTNEQIARERRTSTHTVANQIARIFAKLGVSSRIELAHRLAVVKRKENCP